MPKGARNLFAISIISYITIGPKAITMWPVLVGVSGVIYGIAPRWHLALVGIGLVGLPAGACLEKSKSNAKITTTDMIICLASVAAAFGGFTSLIYSSKLIAE